MKLSSLLLIASLAYPQIKRPDLGTAASGEVPITKGALVNVDKPAPAAQQRISVDITCTATDHKTPCLLDAWRCDEAGCRNYMIFSWRIQPGRTFRFYPHAISEDTDLEFKLKSGNGSVAIASGTEERKAGK